MNEFALVLGMGAPLHDSPWLTAERVNTSVSPAIAFVASIACADWTDPDLDLHLSCDSPEQGLKLRDRLQTDSTATARPLREVNRCETSRV
jgi:hypothetical protein